MHVSPRFPLAAVAALMLVAAPSPAPAQDSGWMRGLDELMSLEVTSVSKKDQRIADTSAAVYVLTREDIRRSGLRTVADLLRLVPGLHVAQIDGNKWAISSRGMSSRWSNKLQVMIDGRSVYTPYFASVFWDAVDVPVSVIERIEVIRGPGASIWGANAVNGVINIITMDAVTRRETTVTAGAGATDFGAVLHEGRLGDRIGYRLFADASSFGELVLADGRGAQDDWDQRRIGGSFHATLNARDVLEGSFHGSDSHARSPHMAVTSLAPFDGQVVPFESVAESWAASGRWTRQLTGAGELQVEGFVDEWWREDYLDHFRRTLDVSAHYRPGAIGRHDLIWGGGYRATHDLTTGSPFASLSPEHHDDRLASAFAQDEIALAGGRVHATLGGKVEHRDATGLSFQPTARLHWRLAPGQAVWTAVSRAQRAPDRVERSIRLNIVGFPLPDGMPAVVALVGNPDVRSEWMTAYEVGYRTVLGGAATLDVAGYYNRYSDLMANVPAAPRVEFDSGRPYLLLPLQYINTVNATTAGGEAVITYTPSTRWKVSGSYSLFSIDPEYLGQATAASFDGLNAPQQHGFVRSSLSLPLAIELDTTLMATGGIRNLRQPAYTRIDNRIAWSPRPRVELSLVVQNLFDARQVEFSSRTSIVVEPSRVPRTAYGSIAWRF